jgi:Ca2+-transporting ATPase
MITGDHKTTAAAIARDLGIISSEEDKVITSLELNELSEEELDANIEKYCVYARVAPSDKVRIVKAWKKKGKTVAMTGDGVNDAPALKLADIGCAMGITGTDVSKEASDMILMDDNFNTIVEAVKEGRGIYSNVKKCVKYLLSSNIGEVVTIFVASLIAVLFPLVDLGLPLLPIHLLWINLITDSLPAFGLGMEKADESVMNDKPRNKDEGFFANRLGLHIAIEGLFVGSITLASYLIGQLVLGGSDPDVALSVGQTMAFMTLSSAQLFHAFNVKCDGTIFNKKTFNNKMLNIAFIVGMALQFVVIYTPGLNDVFKLQALGIVPLLVSMGLAMSIVAIMEIYKLVKRLLNK